MNPKYELKNHVLYEFFAGAPNRENILFESRGVINGLSRVITEICKDIEQQAKETCDKKTEIFQTYIGKLTNMGLSSFFDNYSFEITTRYGNNKGDYKGGFYPYRSLSDSPNGVICSPMIEFSVEGNNPMEIINTIRFAIGHELTHAYNLVMYARKKGLTVREIMDNYLYGQHYSNIKQAQNYGVGNKKAIAYVLYHLNRMERNAYLAQLKQELEAKADLIMDSESAWQAVLESESYKKFKNIQQNVYIMCGRMSPAVKKELVDATNDITGKKFKNYNQVIKFYLSYWNVWKKKYLSTAAKIAYDVFEENNVMVDGYPNTDLIIKDR